MKILALDQATKITGYSLWDNETLKEFGHFEIESKDTILRMEEIYNEVNKLIKKYNPNYIAIEAVQFQKNYKVYSTLSQLQGVLFSLFFQVNKPFFIVEPNSWKSFSKINLKNKRELQKQETINIVENLFEKEVSEDEADAILLGRYACSFIKEIKDEKN